MIEIAGGLAPKLAPGDKVVLIKSATTIGGALETYADNSIEGYQGDLLVFGMSAAIDTVTNAVGLTVNSVGLIPESKALPEAFLAGPAFLDVGFDMVAGEALDSAVRSARAGTTANGMRVFATVGYTSMEHDTGSRVEVKGLNVVLGLSKAIEFSGGAGITVGVFGEYGDGDYDTYNDFSNLPEVKGEGDVKYSGAGLMLRADLADMGSGHFHLEGAARYGRVENKYSTPIFSGGQTAFNIKSDYYGAFLGFGFLHDATDSVMLDYYARYYWTRVEGSTFRLPAGDVVTFDDVNTHRVRGGIRANYAASSAAKLYFGLGVDYSFSGTASATAYGMPIREPEIKGAAGFGELGIVYTPESSPVSVDVSLHGNAGKRKGIGGTAMLRFDF
jgi:hypothetical protein